MSRFAGGSNPKLRHLPGFCNSVFHSYARVQDDPLNGSADVDNLKKGLNVTAQAFTIPQFIDTFKVGRTRAYEEIASGRLATYKVGRRRYISAHAAAEWQRKLESATSGEKLVMAVAG